ncbi:ATP-binding protein [Massilia sp. R2A-15]|uniref:ATP-binding protein n=1 Tax=Massilia sp. R2A-15 TaxID=3064278 RepID=UPI00273430F5|nr:ATP-binding protein [Massilia sp. R2A-15]WLI87623.1 ATP-binding protein [Massilia sp. R2A-15]
MRISIGHRLFASVLLAMLAVAAAGIALMRQNVTASFGEYALNIELDRLGELSGALARQYSDRGGWDFLPPSADERRLWIARELERLDQRRFDVAPPPINTGVRSGGPDPISPPAPPVPPAPPLPPLPLSAQSTPGLQDRITLLDARGAYLAGRPLDSGPSAKRAIGPSSAPFGFLAVSRPPRPSDALARAFLRELSDSLVWIVGASIALSAGAAMLLAAHFRKPIGRLAGAARELADGRFDVRLPADRSDELGELAHSFNQLAHKLEAAEQSRRQWVADTSHELRTPLSVLRAQLEAIQDGVRAGDPATVASMLRQVLSLNKLIDDLYALARSDVGTPYYQRMELDLWPLALEQATAFEDKLAGAGLRFAAGAPPAASTALADPESMRQVLANLFENCVRYTARGGTVSLHARTDGSAIHVTLDDSAPGVPEDALARLGERFYRVDASRSRDKGGAGLGLALCRRIVEDQGGTLAFAHSPLGGLRVELTLPMVKP